MNKVRQILRDIKLSETLDKELNPLSKKVKEFIDDKLEGLIQFENDNYPDSIFYKKDEVILFEQNLKSERLWCHVEHYWSFFKEEIGLKYSEIQELTRGMVGTHLNYKELTPLKELSKMKIVGTHLNCKEFTPGLKFVIPDPIDDVKL